MLLIVDSKPIEAQELKVFHDFYSTLLTIVNRQGGYFNTSAEELNSLKKIASNESAMSPFAKSILNFMDSKLPYVDGFDIDGNKSLHTQGEIDVWVPLEEEMNELMVYPNPSTGVFEIVFEEQNEATKTVEVYNLEGKLLYEGKSNEMRVAIDLSQLFSGIYVLILNRKLIFKLNSVLCRTTEC
jgi:hypothetical protein